MEVCDCELRVEVPRGPQSFSYEGEYPGLDGGPVVDVKDLRLSNGEAVSPLVWSPYLTSPLGEPLRNTGLRVVNRTHFCKVWRILVAPHMLQTVVTEECRPALSIRTTGLAREPQMRGRCFENPQPRRTGSSGFCTAEEEVEPEMKMIRDV